MKKLVNCSDDYRGLCKPCMTFIFIQGMSSFYLTKTRVYLGVLPV